MVAIEFYLGLRIYTQNHNQTAVVKEAMTMSSLMALHLTSLLVSFAIWLPEMLDKQIAVEAPSADDHREVDRR